MGKALVNDLPVPQRPLIGTLAATLPTDPDSRATWQTALRWIKAFWLLALTVVAGLTSFRGAIADSIASTPHPALVYVIFLVAAVAAVLSGMLLATIVRESTWLERLRQTPLADRDAMIAGRPPRDALSPLYTLMIQTRELPVGQRKQTLDQELDSAEIALMGRAALPTLLSGSLVGIGLVGTFIGLLGTLHDLSGVFSAFSNVGADSAATFSAMIQKLRGPIQGMGTAFVASLYGLLGSLVIGVVVLAVRRAGDELFTALHLFVSDEMFSGNAALSTEPVEGESELSSSMRILAAVTREEHNKLREGIGAWSQALDERLARVAQMTAGIGKEVQEAADYVGSAARRSVDSLEKARETNERLFFGMNEVSKGLIERLDELNRELAHAGGRRQSRLTLAALGLSLFAAGAAIGLLASTRAAPPAPAATAPAEAPAAQPAPVASRGPGEAAAPSLSAPPAVPIEAAPASPDSVVARPGDTLSGLASEHGYPLPDLVAANPQIRNTDAVQVGQVVQLPKR